MTRDLFDRRLRALRRDRAARIGPEMVLYDRAFDECLDRLRDFAGTFDRALLLGSPSADWPRRLSQLVGRVDVMDPGPLFASQAGGVQIEEDRFDFGEAQYDLCVAIGTLDTVNDLPVALQMLRRALRPNSPLIGAISGGNCLPALRASLIAAGRSAGQVIARTHPRIEAATLAGLLSSAGYSMPVVDIDRVQLRYASLRDLVRDLRAMGATAILANRAPPMTRAEAASAQAAFAGQQLGGRTQEVLEILHFVGWRHQSGQAAR